MGAAVWILHPCLQLQVWTAETQAWLDKPCHCVPGALMVKDVINTRTRCGRRTQHWHAYDLCARGLCLGAGGSAVDTACDRMAVTCPCVGTTGTGNKSSTGMGVAHTQQVQWVRPALEPAWLAVGLPGLTFQILASLPYTTAMLLALPSLMSCFSVSLSSSDTKPMKELSGV